MEDAKRMKSKIQFSWVRIFREIYFFLEIVEYFRLLFQRESSWKIANEFHIYLNLKFSLEIFLYDWHASIFYEHHSPKKIKLNCLSSSFIFHIFALAHGVCKSQNFKKKPLFPSVIVSLRVNIRLRKNTITKKKAQKKGWRSRPGNYVKHIWIDSFENSFPFTIFFFFFFFNYPSYIYRKRSVTE